MQTFDTITDARNGIIDFRADHGADIPEYLRARFRELTGSPSPVDLIVGVTELVWANRADFGKPALELAAALASYATINAWHGLQDDGRGEAIVANLRKDIGEIKSAPAAPDARPGYLVEKPTEPTPAD